MKSLENIKVLFGGAFNPPTVAHFKIGDILVNKYGATITYLPSSSVYNKNVEIISFNDRYNMLKLVTSKIGSGANISDYEKVQTEYKGTYLTLKDFKGYYFLIGYDQFVNLKNWINFPKLVSENNFLVIPRRGYDIENAKDNEIIRNNIDNFIFLDDFPILEGSSTEFRLTHNKNIVIEEVYEYIKNNNLYEVK